MRSCCWPSSRPVAVWLAVSADVFASVMLGPQFRAGVPLLLPLLVTARLFGAFNQFYLQLSFQIAGVRCSGLETR